MKSSRGLFVVVEGLDKAGKSTQCGRLASNLQNKGHQVESMRFPDRSTTIGKMIDSYLKGSNELDDHSIHLLFSANRWEAASKIESLLQSGTSVIVDRYYFSGIVYTVAKQKPLLTMEWSRSPDVGLPAPDICFFLDISEEDAATRGGGYGEEKYETKERQRIVRENFYKLFELDSSSNVVKVNGGESLEVVEKVLLNRAVAKFETITDKPIQRLLP